MFQDHRHSNCLILEHYMFPRYKHCNSKHSIRYIVQDCMKYRHPLLIHWMNQKDKDCNLLTQVVLLAHYMFQDYSCCKLQSLLQRCMFLKDKYCKLLLLIRCTFQKNMKCNLLTLMALQEHCMFQHHKCSKL